MARVETVTAAENQGEPDYQGFISLRPNEIQVDQQFASKVRPGPQGYGEDRSLRALADSMKQLGQIVPILVERASPDSGFPYKVLEGARRIAAAKLIEEEFGSSFFLVAVLNRGGDPTQKAIHANIKRRGYTPLQLAYMIQAIRQDKGWEGTKEVSDYLGVSRAQISQHDKLLHKPDGMSQENYEKLLAIVKEGRMSAGAAFYTLTHVEPTKAGAVIDDAERIASKIPASQAQAMMAEQAAEATEEEEPEQEQEQDQAQEAETSAPAPTPTPAPAPAKSKPAPKPKAKPKAKPQIQESHVRRAAAERQAVKGTPLQKTLPDLRRIFEQMIKPKYPDVMRSFGSMMAEQWWRGDASDKELLAKWDAIAACVKPGCK